jgi:O-antigen ligase
MIKAGAHPRKLSALFNPALPGVIFLFGLTFCFALVHILRWPWISHMTIFFYAILFVWTALIAWQRRELVKDFGLIDILFVAFFIIVLVSVALPHEKSDDAVKKYAQYLPFMMIAPYLCGRLMRTADIALLSRTTIFLGFAMLPLLVIDYLASPTQGGVRWIFFGVEHSPLLIGCLLAATLISLCSRFLAYSDDSRKNIVVQLIHYGFIAVITVALVWVKARGWLVVGLSGVGVVAWVASNREIKIRLRLFVYVVVTVVFTLALMPKAEGQFYARLLSPPTLVPSISAGVNAGGTIIDLASCRPLEEGVNSTAIRWVLYQEAGAIFMEHPFFGIGAARFGEQSCAGAGGFPHSTILQGFAELGFAGGTLFVILFSFALRTLVKRCMSNRYHTGVFEARFVLALFVTFLLADQIYGNYFMAVGAYLMLGISARMQVEEKQECVAHG